MTQRVFITGGTSGLGRALALRYAREGAKVCIGGTNEERGAAVQREINDDGGEGLFLPCDVRRYPDLEKVRDELLQRWDGVDVVINNAGVAAAGAIEDITIGDWEWILEINLMGVVRGCKAFTPVFKEQGKGAFVNVASMAGLLYPPSMSSYNVSKAGVIALSETLSQELRDSGIHVSCVCPAFFRSDLASHMRSDIPDAQARVQKRMQRSELTVQDIAESVFQSERNHQFWVLPHARERRFWWLKRYLPTLFDRLMHQQSRR